MLPSMYGRFMREKPSPWLADIRVVRTSVATNPQKMT